MGTPQTPWEPFQCLELKWTKPEPLAVREECVWELPQFVVINLEPFPQLKHEGFPFSCIGELSSNQEGKWKGGWCPFSWSKVKSNHKHCIESKDHVGKWSNSTPWSAVCSYFRSRNCWVMKGSECTTNKRLPHKYITVIVPPIEWHHEGQTD